MRRRKKSKESEKKIAEAISILESIINDPRVPRNIKEAVREAIDSLKSKDDIYVKVDRAVQSLDKVADDVNMDMYTRTQIWNVISILGSI